MALLYILSILFIIVPSVGGSTILLWKNLKIFHITSSL